MKRNIYSLHGILLLAATVFAALLAAGLCSCRGLCSSGNDAGSASVALYISDAAAQKLLAPARAAETGSLEQLSGMYITVALGGDYHARKTARITGGMSVSFDGVPAGIGVYAEAVIYVQLAGGIQAVIYEGRSQTISVKEGSNVLSLPMGAGAESLHFIFVSGSGSSTGDGSYAAPYASLSEAAARIIETADDDADYTICISGTLTGTQELSAALNGMAQSIILVGMHGKGTDGSWQDVLKGAENPDDSTAVTALTVSTSVPVVMSNMQVTGGYYGIGFYGPPQCAGILIGEDAVFTMMSGEVSGNTVITAADPTVCGGGICNKGTFTMAGGTVSGNSAQANSGTAYGGGVCNTGTFTMTGGTISGNTAQGSEGAGGEASGGGVYNAAGATFALAGGTVSGNTSTACSTAYGGGITNEGTFSMLNGAVSGNTASAPEDSGSAMGGGIYNTGNAIMMNGSITDNSVTGTAENKKGPDVFALDLTKFVKTGGTVGTEPETSD